MNCKRLLHFTVIVGLWSFYAGNAGAWEGDPVCRMNDLPSVHVGTPVTLLAQNGAGDYDDIDIHGGYDGEDYEPEVPTPAPGAGQPYGDDGPEMDAPVSEPGGDRPYVEDVPDMGAPVPEGGEDYRNSPPEDQGFDPDAGPGGFDDGAPSSVRETPTEPGVGDPYGDGDPNRETPVPEDGDAYPDVRREGDGEGAPPSAGEPYGEEGAYPSDDGGMPQKGIAPGDENEGAYGEGAGDDRIYDEGPGEKMPSGDVGYDEGASPDHEEDGRYGEGGEDRGYEGGQGEDMPSYDGDYSGEGGGGEAGPDEYVPVKKKHHRKARKHHRKAKTSSEKDALPGSIAGSIFKTLGDLTKNYQCELCNKTNIAGCYQATGGKTLDTCLQLAEKHLKDCRA